MRLGLIAFLFLLAVGFSSAVGTFTYTESTNILEVTDGTSGTPATFNDMYMADQAGTATDLLLAESGVANNTLTYQIRPTGDRALVIKCIVAAKTAEADFIFITGTDAWGAAQTESLDVTAGDGTYTTTKRFRTITNLDCSDNANGGGTVWADGTIQVTQNIWGVISAPLGPELITNGDFAGWTGTPPPPSNDTPDEWTISGIQDTTTYVTDATNACLVVSDGDFIEVYQSILVVGKTYRMSVTVTDVTLGSIAFGAGGDYTAVSTVGTYVSYFKATVIVGGIKRGESCNVTFTNVSIKEVLPQYKIAADIDFGNGTTATYFTSLNEMVYFEDGALPHLLANATLQLGELEDGESVNGSAWSTQIEDGYGHTFAVNGSTFNIYASQLTIRDLNKDVSVHDGEIKQSILKTQDRTLGTANIRFHNTSMTIRGQIYFSRLKFRATTPPSTVIDVHIHRGEVDLSFSGATRTVEGLRITGDGSERVIAGGNAGSNVILIDQVGVFPVPSVGAGGTGAEFIAQKYTTNIHVTDNSGADLAGVDIDVTYAHLAEGDDGKDYICIVDHTSVADASDGQPPTNDGDGNWFLFNDDVDADLGGDWNVGFDYKDDEPEFSTVTTDVNGDITEQVIQYKKWVGTSELLEARVHEFTFTKTGYRPLVTQEVIVDSPIVWVIEMPEAVGPFGGAWK